MKSGFSDPTSIKKQEPVDKPKDGNRSPWDFTCPQYDQRTSCFVNAGTHYGVGHKQPVGHGGDPEMRVPTMPFGRIATMEVDEKA
jgi:hypothetical protein